MEYPDGCSTAMRYVARKVGLYVLEVTPLQGCSFWTSGLTYDTNFLHVSRRIFDLSLHPYQKHIAAISHKLKRFFFNNINNSIEFWKCPS